MRAKYDGRCTECGGNVYVGDDVRFNGRGRGVRHTDMEVCEANERDHAENRAERDMEMWAEYRMAGLGAEQFFADRDYERGVRVGNDY